jgi:hypothetical protein
VSVFDWVLVDVEVSVWVCVDVSVSDGVGESVMVTDGVGVKVRVSDGETDGEPEGVIVGDNVVVGEIESMTEAD